MPGTTPFTLPVYLLNTMNSKTFLLLFSSLFFSVLLIAREEGDPEPGKHNHHHDYRHELGVVNSLAWFPGEDERAYALHLHYIYRPGTGRFGIGAGYERIFDEHGHNWFGFAGTYRPFGHFSINLAPGLAFVDEHPGEFRFATHMELLYEFPVGPLHIGPVLSAGFDTRDYHLGAGIHIAVGF